MIAISDQPRVSLQLILLDCRMVCGQPVFAIALILRITGDESNLVMAVLNQVSDCLVDASLIIGEDSGSIFSCSNKQDRMALRNNFLQIMRAGFV